MCGRPARGADRPRGAAPDRPCRPGGGRRADPRHPGYPGAPSVRAGLLLLACTALRPGEARHLEWADVADGRISIPAGRMKMRRAHVVPMANQVAAVLEAMRPLTGGGRLVLVSLRGGRPLSDLTFNAALRSLGCPGDMHVAHGFRTTFSTLLNEQGWPADRIERQLAHVDANSVRRAYNAAEHLADRARMMQWWADHLDSLADQPAGKPNPRRWGGNAVPERGVGSG